MEFRPYRSTLAPAEIVELRPYVPGEDLTGVTGADALPDDAARRGCMIARDPAAPTATWLVTRETCVELMYSPSHG